MSERTENDFSQDNGKGTLFGYDIKVLVIVFLLGGGSTFMGKGISLIGGQDAERDRLETRVHNLEIALAQANMSEMKEKLSKIYDIVLKLEERENSKLDKK